MLYPYVEGHSELSYDMSVSCNLLFICGVLRLVMTLCFTVSIRSSYAFRTRGSTSRGPFRRPAAGARRLGVRVTSWNIGHWGGPACGSPS
jgi:hypothetical protein